MRKIIAIMVMLAMVCLVSCGDSSSSGEFEFTMPTGTRTENTTTTMSEDKQKMLTFKREPSDRKLTDEQRKQAADEFTVYYSGRTVNEKTGEQQKITGSELQKLKKYAQDILDKKIESRFEGGDLNYNITVSAFENDYKSNSLSAMDKCWIDGFDESFKIVREKFEK